MEQEQKTEDGGQRTDWLLRDVKIEMPDLGLTVLAKVIDPRGVRLIAAYRSLPGWFDARTIMRIRGDVVAWLTFEEALPVIEAAKKGSADTQRTEFAEIILRLKQRGLIPETFDAGKLDDVEARENAVVDHLAAMGLDREVAHA